MDDTEYLGMIIHFIQEHGDPTRLWGYDEERFMRVAPSLHAAWKRFKTAEDTLFRMARDHKDHDLG